jgi:MFS family permease
VAVPPSTARPGDERTPSRRHGSLAFLVLVLTGGHAFGSMAMLVLPAVAPVVARDYGVDASLIGYQISFVSVGLLASLLFLGNLSRKLGPARTNQLGHLGIASSILLLLVPSPAVAAAGSVCIGLGYGLLAPSASALMARFTPPDRHNMVFSIQQTGVPLGGILAALIAPPIAVAVGWQASLLLTVVLLIATAMLIQRVQPAWDDERDRSVPALAVNPVKTLSRIWAHRPLRDLALIGSCFSWGQFVVASYTVVVCVTLLGMSLVAAGTVLTVVQLGNAGGRVLAGWLADRMGGAQPVLVWISWLKVAGAAAAAALSPAWPLALVYVLFGLLGIATGAWAGMVMAAIGRHAPRGQVSNAISSALVFVNVGKFAGPIVFANLYLATHSYAAAFASLLLPAAAALYLLGRMGRSATPPAQRRR